ncbi:hypothetical protein DMUE_1175 [Dictyocoela muelleri]|nr:hypothetical protein DMUE_1175 [Dictyocoela muelleri]
MIFFFITRLFSKTQPREYFNLQEKLCLFSPAVDENGRSEKFDFNGDFVALAYSNLETYLRLGYGGVGSYGSFYSKNQLESDDFRIDLRMNLVTRKKGSMGFWVTKGDWENGDFYGRSGNIEGLLVTLEVDSENNKPPTFRYFLGNANLNSNLNDFMSNEFPMNELRSRIVVRIENKKNILKIMAGTNLNALRLLFKIKNSGLGVGYKFGASGVNESKNSEIRFLAVRTSYVDFREPENIFITGEGERSNVMVWTVFVFASIVVGFMIFKPKDKKRK